MNPSTNLRLSDAIAQRLRGVRRLVRRYVVAQGALRVGLWLMLVFWLGGLVDYLPVTMGSNETPAILRMGLLALMLVGSVWILFRWVWGRLKVSLRDESVALLIERHYPHLNNELVTAVELSHKQEPEISNPVAHRAMVERVHRSVTEKMARVEPAELFNWQPLWAWVGTGIVSLVITLFLVIGINDWTGRWARRLFLLSDEPWPRQAALRADGIQLQIPAFSSQISAKRILIPFEDGVVRVPNGSAAMLQISADSRAPALPEVCTLFYRSLDGGRGRANLRRVGSPRDGWQQFTLDGPPLDGLSSDMFIDVVGLDARLRDLRIEVVEPAVIADMQLDCGYPRYLMDSLSTRSAVETIAYRSGVSVPEGTDITLHGTASSRLSRVDYIIHSSANASQAPQESPSTVVESPTVMSVEPQDKEFRIPLETLASSLVVEVRLIDEFGLSADQIPRYVITMQEDIVPEVTVQLNGIGLAITANAQLPLEGTVEDDHGIAEVYAEVAVNDAQPVRLPLALNDQKLDAMLDLEKTSEQGLAVGPGDTLGMVVSARDYYDLKESQHVGRGQPMQLSVVTADQLLVILDRQELESRERLDQILDELGQMQEILQRLRLEMIPADNAMRGDTPGRRLEHGNPNVYALPQPPADGDTQQQAEQARRMAALWAQQSVLQADKSQQELSSVAARIDNLRLQLVNNRIDSYDRQARLQSKVHDPLRELLAGEFEELRRGLMELQSALMSGGGQAAVVRSQSALERVILKLEEIQASMLDIESFNEIVDLVRSLLEDHEQVLSETEKQQRQRILDLLK